MKLTIVNDIWEADIYDIVFGDVAVDVENNYTKESIVNEEVQTFILRNYYRIKNDRKKVWEALRVDGYVI